MANEHKDRPVPREVAILRSGQKIPDRMQESTLAVYARNEEVHEQVRAYPELIRGDRRVRFNPDTGEIWVSRYKEPKREVDLDQQTIVFRRGEGDPEVVRELEWARFERIENAIRGMGHIADKYDRQNGPEVLKTKRAINLMKHLIHEFRSDKPMTDSRREELIRMTIAELSAAGFYDAEKTIKQRLSIQITASVHKDSLGRDNPLVARSELGSAMLKTTEEMLFAKLVRQKYPYLVDLLTVERELERFYIEQGIRRIENVLRLGEDHKEIRRALVSLQGFASNYFGSGRVRVAPYRGPAAFAYANIVGRSAYYMRPRLEYYVGPEETDAVLQKDTLYRVYTDPTNPPAMQTWEEIASRLGTAQIHLARALELGDDTPIKKENSS